MVRFRAPASVGIDIKTVQSMAQEIKEVHELELKLPGYRGGNFGVANLQQKLVWIPGGYTGILGTVVECSCDGRLIAASWVVDTRVQTAIAMQ